MSRINAKHVYELWNCHTKIAFENVLKGIPHTIHHFNRMENNRSNANNSQDVYSSIVETITNGNDAVIIDKINTGFFGDTLPANVREAIDAINHENTVPVAHVTVMVQNRTGNAEQNTVTVIDDGSGIAPSRLETTILAYSSDYKMRAPYQHGTFGQGGAATMSMSFAQLIITKTRDGNYYWTVIWTIENEYGIPSYVYLKTPKNDFYSFTEKDMIYVKPFVTLENIDAKNDDVVLPPHGTLRRMFGMSVDASSDRPTSIFRIIQDKMFGSNCYTNIITDQYRAIVTGRRNELDSGLIGQKINAGESPVLLDKVETTPVAVVSMGETFHVTIKAWFVDNFKKKNKDITGIRGFLSNEPKNAAASIFTTFNGQTHGILTNKRVLSEAGFNSLAENVIIEVGMDNFSMAQIGRATVSNRESLKKQFESDLAKGISKFIEGNDTFIKYNNHFSSVGISNDTLVRDLNEIIKTEMIGSITSIQSFGVGLGGGQKSNRLIHNFQPNDPPTRLDVFRVNIMPGETAWVTIKTDAPDYYGPSMNIAMSGFVKSVSDEQPELRDGTMRFQIVCDPNTNVGTTGTINVSLVSLTANEEIFVVSQKKKKNLKSTVPHVNYVRVNGRDDPEYIKAFPGITDDINGSLNYRYDENTKTLTVYENTQTPELVETKKILEKISKSSVGTFEKIISISFTSAAMMVNKVASFGTSGATDADTHQMLSAIGVSYIGAAGTVVKKYIND